MKETIKNAAYVFGKLFQGIIIFFKTLSWATIKSWDFVSKAINYGNDFTTAAREIHAEVEKGRSDKAREARYAPSKKKNPSKGPRVIYTEM